MAAKTPGSKGNISTLTNLHMRYNGNVNIMTVLFVLNSRIVLYETQHAFDNANISRGSPTESVSRSTLFLN